MKTLIRNLALITVMAVAALSSSGCIIVADDPGYVNECGSYSAGYGDYLEVYDCEEAYAYNGSLVDAYWGSTVYAYNGSTVYAYNGSLVYAYSGSTVHAYPGSEVIAYAGSWVYVHSSAATARSSQALTAETADSGADTAATDTTGGADGGQAAKRSKSDDAAAGPAKITASPGAHVEQVSEQQ
jgi:hypothetical protein